MHKTKSGRWQPDAPAKPVEPSPPPVHDPAAHDRSYEMYQVHRYSHTLCDLHPDCPWCTDCPVCRGLASGNPFAIISQTPLSRKA